MQDSFPFAAAVAALICAAWAVLTARFIKTRPELASRLPRSRALGEIVGVPVLAWAAYHVTKMVVPGSIFIPLSILLVPVVAVAAWGHLDYLFARAFGGLLLLGANHLLTVGFVAEVPARPVFSIFVYLFGLPGLVLVSAPWWLRDLLEKARDSVAWRVGMTMVWTAYALFFLAYALLA
jgi:hypothetical protein